MANAPDPEAADLGETLEFMRLLWSVDHVLQRRSKMMDRSLGVTSPQRLVVRVLGTTPGLSAGQVARTLRLHPSTLTGILRRLEERKILRRAIDPADARRAFLHLSGLGETLNATRSGTIEESVERALAKVSPAQLTATRKLLETLVAELEADLPPPEAKRARPLVAARARR